ncbi:bifunctional enoyl-CoA hydratase/phosphate acetyltransferase [Asaia spathodeae]|uniref:Bifunctional enoyl-CoA hydratase/phosphate acetyltransferase n=1 Tax=Asaia spathodeae TaxID=657016 RepID=A0ABX2P6S6_9PROT|nr:bifunctional enoyl-CoA hydratase/phosphate acetyltransferase [Asaia spathodeae]GBR11957.1 phosphate acetyl/butaryl transferase [Asaia spathodeae NBRC 105894]
MSTVAPDAAQFTNRTIFNGLIARAAALGAVPYAIIWPCEAHALAGALQAAERGILVPVLVGDSTLISAAAQEAGLSLAGHRIVEAATPALAVKRGIELVHGGEVHGLAKGSLHTDTLMHGVVAQESGLRTGRRMSHVFVMAVAGRSEPVFITDAAINITPDLTTKQHIVQNAIDLHQALGFGAPLVAILSAVETLNPKIQGTLDAACLSKMAERGEITGGLIDGPLALDGAVDPTAAKIKNLTSPVAGRAQILVVPDLEAGNIVVKALSFLGQASSGGIVLGAKVPVLLTSRADSIEGRLDSAALGALYARALKEQAG